MKLNWFKAASCWSIINCIGSMQEWKEEKEEVYKTDIHLQRPLLSHARLPIGCWIPLEFLNMVTSYRKKNCTVMLRAVRNFLFYLLFPEEVRYPHFSSLNPMEISPDLPTWSLAKCDQEHRLTRPDFRADVDRAQFRVQRAGRVNRA